MSTEANRKLWMAGNLFKHADGIALGLYALGELLKSVDHEKVEENTMTNIGFVIYELGASLSEITNTAKEHCGMPDCQN